MNRLFFIFLPLLAACSVSAAAQTTANNCPEITVVGPSALTRDGDQMAFTASGANPGRNSKLEYDWTITAGTIESGQGTAAINVRTTPEMGGTNITATVKIVGIPAGCNDKAFEIAGVAEPPIFCYFPYTINRATIRNNLFLLDNLLVDLTDNPESHGLISVRLNERESRALKLSFINRVYKFLMIRKAPFSRITFAVKKGTYETEAAFSAVPAEMAKGMSDGSNLVINGTEYKQKINDIFKPNK
jgi:hypothetical protein